MATPVTGEVDTTSQRLAVPGPVLFSLSAVRPPVWLAVPTLNLLPYREHITV